MSKWQGLIDFIEKAESEMEKNMNIPRPDDCAGMVVSQNDEIPIIREACENFWQYACSFQGKEKALDVSERALFTEYENHLDDLSSRLPPYSPMKQTQRDVIRAFRRHEKWLASEGKQSFAVFDPNSKNLDITKSIDFVIKQYRAAINQDGSSFVNDDFHQLALNTFSASKQFFDPGDIDVKELLGFFFHKNLEMPMPGPKSTAGVNRLKMSRVLKSLYKHEKPIDYFEAVSLLLIAIHVNNREKYERLAYESPGVWKEIQNRLYTEADHKRDKDLFKKVTSLVHHNLLGALPESKDTIKELEEKIDIVSPFLEYDPLLRDAPDSHNPPDPLLRGAYFSDGTNSIVLQLGTKKLSESMRFSILAHEYGHAVEKFFKSYESFGKNPELNKWAELKMWCLQIPDSIGARPWQRREAFADWIAAETMAAYLNDSNLDLKRKRDFLIDSVGQCAPLSKYEVMRKSEKKGPMPEYEMEHPRWDKRTNEILFAHPQLRKLFGCHKTDITPPRYCK